MSAGSVDRHRRCVERTEWQVSVGPEREPEPGDAVFAVRLPPQPASVSLARRHVHDLLERGGRLDLDEIATLLVSEVVTNALLHAGTDIDLSGRLDRRGCGSRWATAARTCPRPAATPRPPAPGAAC